MARLFHLVEGHGPPLLLLNGGLMSASAWEPIAAPLRQRWTVLRCDFRGQLRSPGEPPLDLAGHVAELVSLLDGLGIERVHVAGTSFGAFSGLVLAALHPRRVMSLSAITASDRLTGEVRQGLITVRRLCQEAVAGGDGGRVFDVVAPATFSTAWLQQNEAALAERRRQVAALPALWFAGLARLVAAVENLDLQPLLPRIACPVLVIGGSEDRTFPVEHSVALSAAIPGAALEVLAGGSHGLVLERAAEVAALVDAFLGGLVEP
jgi:3-oxoadipate enol-lactonase